MIDLENKWLQDLIGKSFNSKSRHDAHQYMKEQQTKFFGGHLPHLKETAHVTACYNGEIKSIGASCVNDLILDNFGKLLSALWRSPADADKSVTLTNTGSTSRSILAYGADSTGFAFNVGALSQTVGTYFQLGSGSTNPARTDINIETALGSSPESGLFVTGDGAWSSANGTATASNTIIAGGSGTINESGMFSRMYQNATGVAEQFMIAHDAINPSVGYSSAQTLTCEYVWNL